jgi:hypothetical protein
MQPALIAAAVTVLGWYVTYAYARRREDQTRRIELRLKYRQRQIEELYGPLLSLIEQIFNVWEVRQSILASTDSLDGASRDRVNEFIWKEYFLPLHHEIRHLLRTKLYLLEEDLMPETFSRYLQHSTQEECQHRIRNELQIKTYGGMPWPKGFYEDVKQTFEKLMADYQGRMRRMP